MAFEIIKAETRTESMLGWFQMMCSKITDFSIGSKFRTKFESIAVEMERQDYEFEQAVRQAIPVAVYDTFTFDAIQTTKASGLVRFTSNITPIASIRIPKGTKITTVETETNPARAYETMADAFMLPGQTTVDASILSIPAGAIGNTPSLSITVMTSSIQGIDAVTNLLELKNGSDTETENSRRLRFQEYIASLDRSTDHAIEYGAKTAILTDGNGTVTTRVLQAKVYEPFLDTPALPAADIQCHIFSGTGLSAPTKAAIVAEAQRVVNGYIETDGTIVIGYKAAGVVCTVIAATEVPTAITIAVQAPDKTTAEKVIIHDLILTAFGVYIESLRLKEPLIHSKLIDIAMGIPGVYKSVVTVPADDVAVAVGQVITAGTITITVT